MLALAAGTGKLGSTMRMRVMVAGKPALGFAKTGVEEYLRRLSRHGGCELEIVRAGSSDEVSRRLLEKSEGCHRIALDERGEDLSTRALAARLDSLALRGEVKTVAFLIGAADGHAPFLREACDTVLKLSSLTLQHELALLVLLEQLYRVASLRAGSPYHRD